MNAQTGIMASVEQKSMVPFVPASGAVVKPTVTVAVTSTEQLPVAVTVYVYVPAVSTAGLKSPVPLASAGDQVPPESGVPPKLPNKSVMASVEQKSIAPFVPASGACVKPTVTVADAAVQTPEPVIVYV